MASQGNKITPTLNRIGIANNVRQNAFDSWKKKKEQEAAKEAERQAILAKAYAYKEEQKRKQAASDAAAIAALRETNQRIITRAQERSGKAQQTAEEKAKANNRLYSNAVQITGGAAVSLSDRARFTKAVNTKGRTAEQNRDYIGDNATDEEIRVAKYYWEKANSSNATAADKEAWKDIQYKIKQNTTLRTAQEISANTAKGTATNKADAVGDWFARGGIALGSGVVGALEDPINYIRGIGGGERLTTNAYTLANKMNSESTGKAGQLALSAVESTGRMIPASLIGAATNPIVGATVTGAGAAGSALKQALDEGASHGEAMAFATLIGAFEAALGYVLGGVAGTSKKLGGKVLSKAAPKLSAKLAGSLDNVVAKVIKNPSIRKALLNYIGDVGSEAAEEYLQAQIEPVLSNIILETDKEINPVSQESFESALLGGFMAAVLNIPSTAVTALTPSEVTRNEATTAAEQETATGQTTTAPEQTAPQNASEPAKMTVAEKAVSAVRRLHDTGEITSREIDYIRATPEAQELYAELFGEDVPSLNKAAEFRRKLRAAGQARKSVIEAQNSAQPQDVTAETAQAGVTHTPEQSVPQKAPTAAERYGDAAKIFEEEILPRQDETGYAEEWDLAYNLGATGVKAEHATDPSRYHTLNAEQIKTAYNQGRASAESRDKSGQIARLTRAQSTGSLSYDGGTTSSGITLPAVSEQTKNSMNDEQKATVEFMEKVISEQSGLRVVFYESEPDSAGKYGNINGMFDTAADTIYIDINGKKRTVNDNKALLAFVAGHELTHFAEKWSGGGYEKYKTLVLDYLANADGKDLNTRIRDEQTRQFESQVSALMERYPELTREEAESRVEQISFDKAVSEIVARASEEVLTDSRFAENLAKKDASLYEQFKSAVRKIIDRLRQLIRGETALASQEAQDIHEYIKKIAAAWDIAMTEAVENYRAANVSETAQAATEQMSERRSDKYSYEELVSKPDMKIVQISSDNIPKDRAAIVQQAKANAAVIGKVGRDGSVSVYVPDINTNVILSMYGLRHGLDRRLGENAPVTIKAGEIIQNAVRVNEFIPSRENAEGSYVLIGFARDTDQKYYVTRFVVNRFSNTLASMDVLYAINAKKESGALNAPRLTDKPLSITDSTISIAQLLDLVNEYFPDVLSESVLRKYGYTERPGGELGESALYSERDADTYVPSEEKRQRYTEALRRRGIFTRPKGTSKLAESLRNNGNLDESSNKIIEELYNDPEGRLVYEKKTNKGNIEAAERTFENVTKDVGMAGAVNHIKNLVDGAADGARRLTSEDSAFMVLAARKAAAAGDTDAFTEIVVQASLLASEVGQVLQAFSLVRQLSGNGQRLVVERQLKRYAKQNRENFNRQLGAQKKFGLAQAKKLETKAWTLSSEIMSKIEEKLSAAKTDAMNAAKKSGDREKIGKWYDDLVTKISKFKELAAKSKDADEKDLKRIRDLEREIETMPEYRELLKKLSGEDKNFEKKRAAKRELESQIHKRRGETELSIDVLEMLSDAKTPEEHNEAYTAAMTEIGKQTPLTILDYIDLCRMGALLSGPMSINRNIDSNALQFAIIYSARQASGIAQKAIKPDKRTAAPLNMASAKDRKLLKWAWEDYRDIKTEAETGGRIEAPDAIVNRAKSTGNRAFDFVLKDYWQKALEWGDIPFLKLNYATSLASYLKARKIDPFTANAEPIRAAREFAINEAQEATYRQTNQAASWLSAQERKLKLKAQDKDAPMTTRIVSGVGYVFAESVMPFKSVPANILRQGLVTYTPAGIVRGAAQAVKNKGLDGDAITQMCKGMTGTMIAGVGAWLASQGLIHAGNEDEKDKYLQQLGQNSHSIDIGKYSLGVSWIGPMAIPLFLGASIYDAFKEGFEFGDILNLISDVVTPVIDTSFLSGVNDYVGNIANNGWQGVFSYPVSNYLSQFSPASLNTINKIFIDTTRRSTAGTKSEGGAESNFKYAINRVMSRTPGLSFTLEEYVDCWGRTTDTGNIGQRAIDNIVDVTNTQTKNITPVDAEIIRLYAYEYEGATITRPEVIPAIDNTKKISAKDSKGETVDYTFSSEEMKQYKQTRGATAYDTVEDLISSNAYKGLDDDVKAEAISTAYTYATAQAKMSITRVQVDSWILKASNGYGGLTLSEVLACRSVISSSDVSSKDEIISALKKAGLSSCANDYYEYYKSSSNTNADKYVKYLKKNDLWKYSEKSMKEE